MLSSRSGAHRDDVADGHLLLLGDQGERATAPVAAGCRDVSPSEQAEDFVMTHRSPDYLADRTGLDEDALLLWQAAARAEAVLDAIGTGDPPLPALTALLGYLREVVLTRIAEEEQQLFPALGRGHPTDIDQLREDHLALRIDVDDLAAACAAVAGGSGDLDQLAALARRLIIGLEEHLRREAGALDRLPAGFPDGGSGWARTAHWYLLTEGPLIDLDRLVPGQGDDAVLNRLTHLRAGESVELHGRGDPRRLRRRLHHRAPGDYGWAESRDDDPDRWRVTVTRRPGD